MDLLWIMTVDFRCAILAFGAVSYFLACPSVVRFVLGLSNCSPYLHPLCFLLFPFLLLCKCVCRLLLDIIYLSLLAGSIRWLLIATLKT